MKILMIGKGDHSVYTEEILNLNYNCEVTKTLWPTDLDVDFFDGCIIAIGDNFTRERIYNEVREYNVPFVNAIHPSCIVSKSAKIGHGVVAMAGVIFNVNAIIGNCTFFATGAQVEHDCHIEDFASVSAGSVLGGHVKVKQGAAITLGCTVFDRVGIGEYSVIGSGSLVTNNIPPYIVAYGSPCRFVRGRTKETKWL